MNKGMHKTIAKNKANRLMHIQSQNAKKQAIKHTRNCVQWMCPHDAKYKMKISKKNSTMICQFFNQNKQKQHRAKDQIRGKIISKCKSKQHRKQCSKKRTICACNSEANPANVDRKIVGGKNSLINLFLIKKICTLWGYVEGGVNFYHDFMAMASDPQHHRIFSKCQF